MNPGIFYFYHYTPNRPPSNVGFLKLNQQFQSCSLELHIRNVPISQGTVLKLGTFCTKDRQFPAVFLSDLSARTNAIFAKFTIEQSLFPGSCTLSEISGFFLQLSDGNIIAAVDPGVSFEPKLLRFTMPAPSSDEPSMESPSEALAESPSETSPESPTETSTESPAETSTESLTETLAEVSKTSPVKDEIPADTVAAPKDSKTNIRKIRRRDLRILPRKYWNISNNSFLMHGYHNYNHLLLIEKDGYYTIGVPGIYSTRESHAASLFGFPQFTSEYNQTLHLTAEEQNDYGTFGYWLCEIK